MFAALRFLTAIQNFQLACRMGGESEHSILPLTVTSMTLESTLAKTMAPL
jgi:hypothetical protein